MIGKVIRLIKGISLFNSHGLRADKLYNNLHSSMQPDDPRALGYRSKKAFQVEKNIVVEYLLLYYDSLLLDLASGSGLMTKELSGRDINIVGLDYNSPACVKAKNNGLSMVRASAFELPFLSSSFDTMVSVELIQQYSIEDLREFFLEVSRSLSSGGHFILVWPTPSLVRYIARIAYIIKDNFTNRDNFKIYHHSVSEIIKSCSESGMDTVSYELFFPFSGFRHLEKNLLTKHVFGSNCILICKGRAVL